MRAQIFSVYKKTVVNDPQFAKEQNRTPDQGDSYEIYEPMFSTTDEEHAKFVCRNEDGRYVFTSQPMWFGELA